MAFQSPRGTEDVLPQDVHRWLKLESDFRALTRLYGYRELRTPTFEEFDLFVRTSGETSDIVSKEMYDFVDKGGRRMALKPEWTASGIRAVIEHGLCPPGTVCRLSYITPIFRYGRPQKGRLREAHQLGLELVGSASSLADAEVIEITADFYRRIGIPGIVVKVNSIGRQECRERYRAVVLERFGAYLKDQDAETNAKAQKNPLRLLDSKDPLASEIVKQMPPILDYLEDESRERFESLLEHLREAEVPFEVAPDVVRGLDYYTETVFEVQSSHLGAQSSLCGGGRYDDLVKELGGPPTPSVGVAMGIERALIVLEEIGQTSIPDRPDVYVVAATEDAAATVRKLARDLRRDGTSALFDLEGRKMAGQLKQADKAGARVAMIVGSDELARGVVTVRNLSTGEQTELPIASVPAHIRELL